MGVTIWLRSTYSLHRDENGVYHLIARFGIFDSRCERYMPMFTELTYNCYKTLIGLLTCDVEFLRREVELLEGGTEWLYFLF